MGHSLQRLQRGKELGQGDVAAISGVTPPSCSSLGRWQWAVRAGVHISHPQGPASRHGVQGSATAPRESLASLCPPCYLGPSLPFLSLNPQCWLSPTAPCPSCAPVLPALCLSQGLLPSLLPRRNKSPSQASLGSQWKQLPTLSPLSHGTWLLPGCCEAFPRAQEVHSGKAVGDQWLWTLWNHRD